MEDKLQYTLRLDAFPLVDYGAGTEKLPMEVHLYSYGQLDEAFMRLYSIPVSHFDEHIAATTDKKLFIKEAAIYENGNESPLMKVERSNPSLDRTLLGARHMPDAAIYLNKGENHELLTPGLREMFRVAGIDSLENLSMPLASYNMSGTQLFAANKAERDVITAIHQQAEIDQKVNPYRLETKAHVYHDQVPTGTKNGVVVLKVIAAADLRQALAGLFAIDMEKLDPVMASNKQKNEIITSAIIKDNIKDSPLIEILSMPHGDMFKEFSVSGMYLHFHTPVARYLTELTVPEIKLLAMTPGDLPVFIAEMSRDRTKITPTERFEQFCAAVTDSPESLALRRIKTDKTIDPDQPGQKHGL